MHKWTSILRQPHSQGIATILVALGVWLAQHEAPLFGVPFCSLRLTLTGLTSFAAAAMGRSGLSAQLLKDCPFAAADPNELLKCDKSCTVHVTPVSQGTAQV